MRERYLLCRPQGGLNDMLCQVEKCCRYAEAHGRVVIVDTCYAHSAYVHVPFSRFFRSRHLRLRLELDPALPLDSMTVAPHFLAGRVNSYVAQWLPDAAKTAESGRKRRTWQDPEAGKPVSFDFGRPHPEHLLVHHAIGGGEISLFALLRLVLAPEIASDLRSRLASIDGSYDAIHVRHTDLRSNYAGALAALQQEGSQRPLFVATDNAAVVAEFRAKLGGRFRSFSALPATEVPLHKLRLPDRALYRRDRDAILDLLMLGLSRRLVQVPLATRTEPSGYAMLAAALWNARPVLSAVIGAPDLRTGLD